MTDYALGKESFKVVTGDMVTVFITSNITSFTSEKRMDKSITVADLKSKLELICGASAGAMTITVFDKDDRQVCSLEVCGQVATINVSNLLQHTDRQKGNTNCFF